MAAYATPGVFPGVTALPGLAAGAGFAGAVLAPVALLPSQGQVQVLNTSTGYNSFKGRWEEITYYSGGAMKIREVTAPATQNWAPGSTVAAQNTTQQQDVDKLLKGNQPPTQPPKSGLKIGEIAKPVIYAGTGLVVVNQLTKPGQPGPQGGPGLSPLQALVAAPGDLLANTGQGAGTGFQGLFGGVGSGLSDLFKGIFGGAGEGAAAGASGVGRAVLNLAVPAALVAGGFLVFKAASGRVKGGR